MTEIIQYQCDYCPEVFDDEDECQEHEDNHNPFPERKKAKHCDNCKHAKIQELHGLDKKDRSVHGKIYKCKLDCDDLEDFGINCKKFICE